jgi:hypothetical protein
MSTIRNDSNGRLDGGRFAPGHQFAKGNPNARRMYALRKALLDSAGPDDVRRVGKKLLDLAEGGDVAAAKVWLEYTVGKPPQALELSGPDGEPLGVDWPRLQAVLLGALGRYPEAKVAVAVALRGLADDARDDGGAERPGDGPRPEPADGGPGAGPGPLAAPGLEVDG